MNILKILLIVEFVQKTYEKDEVEVKDHDHISSVFWTDVGQTFKVQARKKNSHLSVYPYLKICYYKRELYE